MELLHCGVGEVARVMVESMATRGKKRRSAAKKPAYHHGDLRNALLTVARQRLEHSGLEALTLRGLAKAAGVSHAAPAHHFADRQGLLWALVAAGYHQLTEAMRTASAGTDTPQRELDAIGLAYVRFAVEHPQLFRLMFQETARRAEATPEVIQAACDCQSVLADTMTRMTSQPIGTDLSPAALMAWAGVHGLATLWIDGQLRGLFPGRGGKAAFLRAVETLLCANT